MLLYCLKRVAQVQTGLYLLFQIFTKFAYCTLKMIRIIIAQPVRVFKLVEDFYQNFKKMNSVLMKQLHGDGNSVSLAKRFKPK